MDTRPIGVFDSGMGGLSVLKDLRRAMPGERFIYFGDNENAPYGPRAEDEICALSRVVAQKLMRRNIKALAIACNTAASAAEEVLRSELPIPVCGIEPELARAKAHAGDRAVIVLATEATLGQPRYRMLREKYCPDAISVPAPEPVLMVERGALSGEEPERYFRERLEPHLEGDIGAIVLGCTHFLFLKRAIRRVAPAVELFDGNARMIDCIRGELAQRGALASGEAGPVELLTSSGDPGVLARMQKLMEVDIE